MSITNLLLDWKGGDVFYVDRNKMIHPPDILCFMLFYARSA